MVKKASSRYNVSVFYKIINAGEKELKGAARLHGLLFKDIGETRMNVIEASQSLGAHTLAVVRPNTGAVVGYLQGVKRGREAHLSWFGVRSNHRGRGLGELLLKKFETWARNMGLTSIGLTSRNRYKAAMRLYLKHGFDITGTSVGPDGDLLIHLRLKLKTNR
jgi:ribosomal protein S18 acetylase RimI-like enzyme